MPPRWLLFLLFPTGTAETKVWGRVHQYRPVHVGWNWHLREPLTKQAGMDFKPRGKSRALLSSMSLQETGKIKRLPSRKAALSREGAARGGCRTREV